MTKMARDHANDLAAQRDRYEEQLLVQEQILKKEKQAWMVEEMNLRKRLEEQAEMFAEEKRNLRRQMEESIARAEIEKREEINQVTSYVTV